LRPKGSRFGKDTKIGAYHDRDRGAVADLGLED
jgi:hypothetical protein